MSVASPYETALIPVREAANGPVTTARLRRTALVYAGLFLVGTSVAAWGGAPGVQAFGLGLVAPGGGFLLFASGGAFSVVAHVILAVVSVVLFGLALFAWFGSGNVLAPIGIWLGAALVAGAMNHHETWSAATAVVPGLVAVGAAGGWVARRRQLSQARRRRDRRNAFLAESRAVATPRAAASTLPLVEELSREDLAAMRFALDRGLQPVEQFNGFEWIEQFQTASIRYAIMTMSYGLSQAQLAHVPALRGYLSQAQLNLIEKMKIHRVWRYWAYENAWGNLRLNPDPMAPDTHDNVMYSGWYAAMIGMYASNTGDDRYDKPGSITLRHPSGREFVYDFPQVARILAENFRRVEFTLFPCEPNWIYLMCNNFAGIALAIHDRMRGTDDWARLGPEFRRKLDEEFLTVDGRIVAIRSSRTGLTIPALTSTMADAGSALYLHAIAPEAARRSWEIVRHDLLRVSEGQIELDMRGWDNIDTGNYRRSNATALASVMAAAVEMGDAEAAHAASERFEADHPAVTQGGVRHHPGVSVMGHNLAFAARGGRANAMLDLVASGPPREWREGPLLDRVAYPDVLVARACSDGRALEAVLYPGAEAGRHTVGLSQLRPGGRYRSEGAASHEIVADAVGRADVAIDLADRSELRIRPIE